MTDERTEEVHSGPWGGGLMIQGMYARTRKTYQEFQLLLETRTQRG